MAQKITGLRSIFSNASVYNLAQRVVGAEKTRRLLVHDYFPQQPSMRILDIGCGTAEILRHLPLDIDYFGFDASQTYISEAKRRFGRRGTFKAKLVRKAMLNDMEPFDIVLAFGLLHHLGDDEARMLFKLGRQALKQVGRLITIDPVYSAEQNQLARWIISKDRGQNIRTAEAYSSLAKTQFDQIITTVRHDMLYIPYTHLILECKNHNIQTF